MTWRRFTTLIAAAAILAAGCGGTSKTTVTNDGVRSSDASVEQEVSAVGQPCEPGPSADAGVDGTIDPDRRGEALVLHLTGIDEMAVTEENEGEDLVYSDPNYGGVWGDFAGGWVVAVVDCSQVDPDRIAQIAGGPDAVRLIKVAHAYEEVNEFRDILSQQLGDTDLPYGLGIDSTLNGREIVLTVEDPDQVPANLGDGVPDGAYKVEEGQVDFGDPIDPLDPDPPPKRAEPDTTIGALDCGDSIVVEDRLANDGQEPIDMALAHNPDAVRVESLNPLQWEAFDANDQVVALLAIGDDDLQDWQVWTCE